VAAGAAGVYVAGENVGPFPASDAFVAKIAETMPPAPMGSGARVAGLTVGSALTPEQLAPIVEAVSQEFALRWTSASAPPEMGATAKADQLAGSLVPEPFAAAQPASESEPAWEAASPRPNVAARLPDEGAGYSLDGALLDEPLDGVLLDELAMRLLGGSSNGERNQPR